MGTVPIFRRLYIQKKIVAELKQYQQDIEEHKRHIEEIEQKIGDRMSNKHAAAE